MNLDDLKIRLGIDPDDVNPVRDAKLEADLVDAISYVREWTNNPFKSGMPAAVRRAIVLLVQSAGQERNVSSERLGDMQKSYFDNGTMKAVHEELRPYRLVRFRPWA